MGWPAPATVRWMTLVILLILWEVVPLTGLLPELFLPSLSKTLTVLWIDRHIYFEALLVTLYEVAASMLIACGLGILVGAALLLFVWDVTLGGLVLIAAAVLIYLAVIEWAATEARQPLDSAEE